MSTIEPFRKESLRLLRVYRARNRVCSCASKSQCPAPGKHPAPWDGQKNNGVHNASIHFSDEDFDNYNVGIATGDGLLVVDVDPRNGGHLTWHEISHGHELPSTWIVQTGGGGTHYYFRVPADVRLKNFSFEGVDFQYTGKYVVAPPSIHHSGSSYEFVDCDPQTTTIAEMPDWLVEWITKRINLLQQTMAPSGTQGSIIPTQQEWRWIGEILEKLSPDIGYHNWLGVGMGLHATDDQRAFDIWDEWSRKDKEKYKEGECKRKWASFSHARGAGEFHTYRWIFAMADLYGVQFGKEEEFFKDWKSNTIHIRNWNVNIQNLIDNSGKIISSIAYNALEHSRVKKPEFALAAALQILSGCVQGSWEGPNGLSLNLYQWCAAPAAAGKDSYIKYVKRRIREIHPNVLAEKYNSIGGFRVMLMAYNSRVAVRDEWHDEYLNFTNSKSEYVREIGSDYKILYNTPNELESVLIKASITPRVERPYFGLIGFSTVGGLSDCSQGDFLTSGMGSRFLFWVVNQSEQENVPRDVPLEFEVLEALKKYAKDGTTLVGKDSPVSSKNIEIIQSTFEDKKKPRFVHSAQTLAINKLRLSDECENERQRYVREVRDTMVKNQADEALQSVMGRKAQIALRLACLRCLSDQRDVVEVEDLYWGQDLAQHNVGMINEFFTLNVGTTARDMDAVKRAERLMRVLRAEVARAGEPVLKGALLRKAKMDRYLFNETLFMLIESEKVQAFDRRGHKVYPKSSQGFEREQYFAPADD